MTTHPVLAAVPAAVLASRYCCLVNRSDWEAVAPVAEELAARMTRAGVRDVRAPFHPMILSVECGPGGEDMMCHRPACGRDAGLPPAEALDHLLYDVA